MFSLSRGSVGCHCFWKKIKFLVAVCTRFTFLFFKIICCLSRRKWYIFIYCIDKKFTRYLLCCIDTFLTYCLLSLSRYFIICIYTTLLFRSLAVAYVCKKTIFTMDRFDSGAKLKCLFALGVALEEAVSSLLSVILPHS